MRKEFISIMPAVAMAIGLAGYSDSRDTSVGAATADTRTTEAQKEEVKDDAKKENEKEDPEVPNNEGASDFHIDVIIGSIPQFENGKRGAEALQAIYGEGITKLTIYPGNFTEELKTIIQTTIDLPDGPRMKAITTNQSVPGVIEVLRKTKKTRPGILCITDEGREDLPEAGSTADLACNNDFVAHGYLIIRTAHELGCDTSVHTSFPCHIAYETMSRYVAVMKKTCKEFSMELVLETAPDLTFDVDVAGAQVYILKKVPEWVEKYDKSAVYFYTNDAHTEPLLEQLMEYGGYFTETDPPPPLMGYPGALSVDLTVEAGDFDKVPTKAESTIAGRGGADHFGTWAYSYGYTTSVGPAQRVPSVLNGGDELDDINDIAKVYQISSPKAEWNGSNYTNAETGVKSDNVFLVYQSIYIMGDPGYFMGPARAEVPEKHFTIK